jgi:hypothetical protein
VLFLPVGGGPTVGGEPAAAIVRVLRPRLVVPMHYRTDAVNFLDPLDAFLDVLGVRIERIAENELGAEQLLGTADEPTVALLAAPGSSECEWTIINSCPITQHLSLWIHRTENAR